MSYYRFENLNIAYTIHGMETQVLVVLNGIMMNQKSWQPFMENFTKTRKVITVDLIDQGDSDKLQSSYTIDYQVEAVMELLNYLNIEKFDLFGISYGAHVALNIASKYSNNINKLVLFNCLANTNKLLKDIGNSWIKAAQTYDFESFYYTTIPVIYSTSFYENNYEWITQRKEILKSVFNKEFLDSMIRLIRSSENHDVRKSLSDITCKTLVVGASNDILTPPLYTKKIAKLISNSIYFEIENCGHASMYEKPEEFLTLLLGFLNQSHVTIK